MNLAKRLDARLDSFNKALSAHRERSAELPELRREVEALKRQSADEEHVRLANILKGWSGFRAEGRPS